MKNKDKILAAKFSFYEKPLTNVVPAKEMTVFEIFEFIRGGRGSLEALTRTLRNVKDDQERYRELKTKSFPYVTFSGAFTKRSTDALKKHTNLICIDLDHLGESLDVVKVKLAVDLKHIIGYFVSPGGDGLKVVYPIDISLVPHEQWVRQYEEHIRKVTGIDTLEVDKACKDVARACLIPFDAEPFLNPMLDPQQDADVVPIEIQGNSQIFYEPSKPDAGPSPSIGIASLALKDLKLDFNNLNTEANFIRLYQITTKKEGEYGRPRRVWTHKLAYRCNLFGMDEGFCCEAAVRFLSAHKSSLDESDPFNANDHVLTPIRSTYKTYKEKHGTWTKLETSKFETPELPAQVYSNLPELINDGCSLFYEARERDIFFLGLLTVLSACMPKVCGRYDRREVEANLFLMVVASAASGKGTLQWSAQAVDGILKKYEDDYKTELDAYKLAIASKSEDVPKPQKPIRKSLMIPGNISVPAMSQALFENAGRGLVYETEADTIANTMKNDWGNYSDILRKIFHHERISYRRRTDNEFVEIKKPCASVLLSGTQDQIKSLLGSTENGLFSRFLFYHFKGDVAWKNVFKNDRDAVFLDFMESQLPSSVRFLFEACKRLLKLEFEFTVLQQYKFNAIFESWLLESEYLLGEGCIATIKRLGLSHFRIAMILTTIRRIREIESIDKLICSEEDFNTALLIVDSLKLHAFKIISEMKHAGRQNYHAFSNGQQKAFYLYLPKEFTKGTAESKAKALKVNLKTAEKYLTDYVDLGFLQRVRHGEYIKTSVGMAMAPEGTENP